MSIFENPFFCFTLGAIISLIVFFVVQWMWEKFGVDEIENRNLFVNNFASQVIGHFAAEWGITINPETDYVRIDQNAPNYYLFTLTTASINLVVQYKYGRQIKVFVNVLTDKETELLISQTFKAPNGMLNIYKFQMWCLKTQQKFLEKNDIKPAPFEEITDEIKKVAELVSPVIIYQDEVIREDE